MAAQVVMPALSTGAAGGRVARWLKREGEMVARGEPLLEVETEKAVIEVESPGSGVLSGVRVREGEEAAVGTVLAYVLAPAHRPQGGGMSRAAAERVSRSWREVPHLFLFRDVDVSQLIVAAARQPADVTVTDLVLRLAAATMARHPALGAGVDDAVTMALLVATDDGVAAPVIRGADRLDVAALAARRAELEARARSGDLRPADLTGAALTVSDLGVHGADAFLPTVADGQAGTLGVGRVADRVIPVQGRPQVRPVVTLTLACDQRAVDGVRAARFLDDLASAIEEPARFL